MPNALEQLRAQRFAYLRAVHAESDAPAGTVFLDAAQLGQSLGWDEGLTDKIAQYLVDEGLLKRVTFGHITLTHRGLKEVEEVLFAPEQPTEHFLPLVIAENYMHVGTMTGSQIQQGTTGSVQALAPAEQDEVRRLVDEIRASLAALKLGAEAAGEVEADLAAVEAQLASPRPKATVIREALSSTRTVLEGAAGTGLATAAPHLPHLLEALARVIG